MHKKIKIKKILALNASPTIVSKLLLICIYCRKLSCKIEIFQSTRNPCTPHPYGELCISFVRHR